MFDVQTASYIEKGRRLNQLANLFPCACSSFHCISSAAWSSLHVGRRACDSSAALNHRIRHSKPQNTRRTSKISTIKGQPESAVLTLPITYIFPGMLTNLLSIHGSGALHSGHLWGFFYAWRRCIIARKLKPQVAVWAQNQQGTQRVHSKALPWQGNAIHSSHVLQ